MATVDVGLIPQQTLREATLGVVQKMEGVADRVCRIRTDIETLKGNAPFLSSQATTRRRKGGLKPTERAIPMSGNFGTVAYECDRFTGFAELPDEAQISASAYNIDLVAHWVEEAIKQGYTDVDAELEAVLQSTVLNLEWDVTTDGAGAWTDLTNGLPLTDILEAAKRVPGRNSVIVGYQALVALQNNPQSQGRLSGFASGTVAFLEEARNLIASAAMVNPANVHLLVDDFYNENAEGQGFSTEYVFGNGVWVGKQEDLQLFDPNTDENRKSEIGRVQEGALYQIAHHRYADIVRHVRDNGITLTGIIA